MSKHWFIAHLIEKFTKSKSLGLDIGIGLDNWYEFKKCKMIGIDRNANNKTDLVLDLEKRLPFKDNLFDVVIAINSLNYVKNSRQLLTEVNRILKTDGVLVCVVDNENSTSQPYVWHQSYLNRLLKVTGFNSIISNNLKDCLYAWWYNRSSVYAFAVVQKLKINQEQENKKCSRCGGELDRKWNKDQSGNPCHVKCPSIKPIKYAKSYNIHTTHPDN